MGSGRSGHAIVLGAGIAGLLAARVLAEHYATVTVLERDALAGAAQRRGVPQGRVVGINTAVVNGLGAAIPSATALDFLRNGARPALGVTLRPVRLGLQVLEMQDDGPAAIAGLRIGDVLLCRLEDLHAALDAGGETVRVRFLRDDVRRVREAVVRTGVRAEAAA